MRGGPDSGLPLRIENSGSTGKSEIDLHPSQWLRTELVAHMEQVPYIQSAKLWKQSRIILCIFTGVILVFFSLHNSFTSVFLMPLAFLTLFLIILRPTYGLYITAASLPLGYLGVAEPFHGTLTVTRFLAIATLLAQALKCLSRDYPLRIHKSTKNGLLIAFLLIVVLSSLTAIDLSHSMKGLFYYLNAILLAFLVILALRTRNEVRLLVFSIVLPTLLVLSLGILTYAMGFGPLVRSTVSGIRRITAIGLDPNEFALTLVSIFPICAYSYLNELGYRRRLLSLSLIMLLCCGVILTYSRASVITLVIIMIYMFMRAMKKGRFFRFGGLLAVAISILSLSPGGIIQRMETLSVGEADPSLKARRSYLKVGYEIMKDHPVLGVGPNNYKVAFTMPEYKREGYMSELSKEMGREKEREGRAAHNMYMEVLNEVGTIGFFLFLSICYITCREFRTCRSIFAKQGDIQLAVASECLELGFLAFLLNSFFLSSEFFPLLWLFIGLSSALVRLTKQERLDLGILEQRG